VPDPYFSTLASYNAWANRRLYEAVGTLPEGEYMKPRPSFFGSIHATLNHILVGDRVWLSRLEGRETPPLTLDQILYDNLADLRAARLEDDEHLIRVVAGIDADRLDGALEYRTLKGEAQRIPMRLVLGHVFNHHAHHRGQVHGLLSQTEVAPPSLDLVIFTILTQRR
jgi:uncharacterized damage-inducible protein DinB